MDVTPFCSHQSRAARTFLARAGVADRQMEETRHSSLPPPSGRVDLIVAADIPSAPRMPSWSAQWSVEVQDVEITQTRLEPYFPEAPPDELWVSDDGLMCVPRPRGGTWSARSWHHDTASARASAFELTRSGEHFLLFARDVEARDGHAPSLQALHDGYRCLDEAAYGRVAYQPSRFVEHQGRIALEVVMEGRRMRPTGRSQRVRRIERVLVAGAHQLVVGAEGTPRALAQLLAERERFFAVTRFFHLGSTWAVW
jgi:hypothetical protein